MPTQWTINNAGSQRDSHYLVGCHIKNNGNGYDFCQPDETVLASTTETQTPFSFTDFSYQNLTWTVVVSSLGTPASGSWSNTDTQITEEEGTWTAQAGSGGTAEEETAAASA
jgi:hypothetical protein